MKQTLIILFFFVIQNVNGQVENTNKQALEKKRITQNNSKNIFNHDNWIEHRAVYPDAGFVLEFKYPSDLVIASKIDNCLCAGVNTEHYHENEALFEDNTRQWCICLIDSNQFTADYFISSWKTTFLKE